MAAYGEDSSRSALTFMPPVTRVMVSRPLESPRMLAYEPFLCMFVYTGILPPAHGYTYERSVTWTKVSLKDAKILATPKTCETHLCQLFVQYYRVVEDHESNYAPGRRRTSSPSLTWGPKEMFSWAGRAAFFGGMLTMWF